MICTFAFSVYKSKFFFLENIFPSTVGAENKVTLLDR
jgi:hypothetical protein